MLRNTLPSVFPLFVADLEYVACVLSLRIIKTFNFHALLKEVVKVTSGAKLRSCRAARKVLWLHMAPSVLSAGNPSRMVSLFALLHC
jgi:hypothetical protein